MIPVLRPYQEDGLDAIRREFGRGIRSVLYQAPTGSGKTVLFAHITRGAARKGNNVLISVHRRELIDQTTEALVALDVDHGVISPAFYPKKSAVQIASVQTLVRRMDKMTWIPHLIVVDEAHHAAAGSWQKILYRWPDAKVLGVTATPERLDGKGLDKQFDVLLRGPHVGALIEDGWLSNFSVYAAEQKPDLTKVKTRMGDYAQGELSTEMEGSVIVGDAVEHYQRYAAGLRAIAFCVTIKHAQIVRDQFLKADIRSEVIDGTMNGFDRHMVLRRFEEGRTLVLTSCMIVNEGFDLPSVACAILLRPTKSLALYLQQVGRSLRTAPGKKEAIILDHAGNVFEHGLPTDEIEWHLEGKKKREGVKRGPLTSCEKCFRVYPPPRNPCPKCGHVHAMERAAEPEKIDGELKKVEGKVYSQRERRAYWDEVNACVTEDDLKAFAKRKGHKRGWVYMTMKYRRERKRA